MVWWKTSLKRLKSSEKLAALALSFPLNFKYLTQENNYYEYVPIFHAEKKHIYPFIFLLYSSGNMPRNQLRMKKETRILGVRIKFYLSE